MTTATSRALHALGRGVGHPLLRRRCAAAAPQRAFASEADEDKYLELKQLKDIKSDEFYDTHGQHRRYFYYIDLQGRLFLEDTRPKNIATSLKSAKFLRFFFSQLRPNRVTSSDGTVLSATEKETLVPFLEYPFRSPCGKEMNFIKCADRPIVLEDLRRNEDTQDWEFVFGGGELTMPLRPDALLISTSTGRLYHDVRTKHLKEGDCEAVGLVRSQLAVEMARNIELFEGVNGGEYVGEFKWEGARFPIRRMD